MKGQSMKRALLMLPLAATAIALSLGSASAQNGYWQGQQYQNNDGGWNRGRQYQNGWNNSGWNNGYDNGWSGERQRQSWNNGWNNGYQQRGWNNRYVSDPSYNADVRFRANPYRCTEDLGYGRYEYCGW
jgi:hypothetical protein